MAFPKNSKWTEKFTQVLLSYESMDVQLTLSQVWLSGTCGKQEPITSSTFVRMSIEDVSGALTIVSIGIGVALLLLLVEFIVKKHGFPLSRIWTNDPNWTKTGTFAPSFDSRHLDVFSSHVLELGFSRRRTTAVSSEIDGSGTTFHVSRTSALPFDQPQDGILPGRFGEHNLSFGDLDFNLDAHDDDDSGRGSCNDHDK